MSHFLGKAQSLGIAQETVGPHTSKQRQTRAGALFTPVSIGESSQLNHADLGELCDKEEK